MDLKRIFSCKSEHAPRGIPNHDQKLMKILKRLMINYAFRKHLHLFKIQLQKNRCVFPCSISYPTTFPRLATAMRFLIVFTVLLLVLVTGNCQDILKVLFGDYNRKSARAPSRNDEGYTRYKGICRLHALSYNPTSGKIICPW